MRPGMRHPPPGPPLRPPPRLMMPAPNDGGVFFGGRDYARRQQPQAPAPPPPQQWQNNPNFRPGPMPLLRPNAPWHPHPNAYHSQSPPPPPPLLHPHHPHHQPFNPNSQTPISYVPPNVNNHELMRLANVDQIPFLEPHEEDEPLGRQHLHANNSNPNDESLGLAYASPSKGNKRRRQQGSQQQQSQQHENNRNVISYQDLDRPEEHNTTFVNRVSTKSNKANPLPTDKTNNHYSTKTSIDNDQALKLELDRIKKASAQEKEKLKAQRQAAAEKEAQMKKNSVKTGENEKREDGELGDSSDDENNKATLPQEPKRLKKIVDNLASQSIKPSGTALRSKTPPSEGILDMNSTKLIRPVKLFQLDEEKNSAYREYLTTNFGRVRVHCHKPQPNFFSNLNCIEEIKRRLRLNTNLSTSSTILRNLLDENEDPSLAVPLTTEPEDGEIESDEENIPIDVNGKMNRTKPTHQLSDDDQEKPLKKRSKLNEDGTSDVIKSSLNEKPWITPELRQLIKQRNKLQAQILNGETNAEIEKKFKKIRNKISKHAKTLKAKYESSLSGSAEPSLAPPNSSQNSLSSSVSNAAATAAANHPLSSILDPNLVMAMLVNPTLYSQVQQQVLSNPSFMQAYQHMFAEGATSKSTSGAALPKVASETQVVPSTGGALDDFLKQAILPKTGKDSNPSSSQQTAASTRSRPVLTQATKPIQLTSLESESDLEQRKNKSRFTSAESSLTDAQAQEIASTQELIRRQLALTQQQQRNQRNSNSTSQLSLSAPLSRHIPLTTEQMQEILTRAKNYVTRQQTDESSDATNNQPRLSYNTRRLQAALIASATSATPQTAHTINQAAAAAIAAVAARPSSSTTSNNNNNNSSAPSIATPTTPSTRPIPPSTAVTTPSMASIPPGANVPPSAQQQQHPIRIQLDQKSKTLSTISNNQSLPIPTISQQKMMPLTDMNHSPPSHMYPNAPPWQRPPPPSPHLPGQGHYPMGPPQQLGPPPPQHYPSPYDNPHQPPYYGPRVNYPAEMRPRPPYPGMPPRHLSQPQRYGGPVPPPPGPYGYGGHPSQNYGPPAPQAPPPPHPHYAHPYPPS